MSTATDRTIVIEREGNVGVIRVDRPERKNAMTADMVAAFVNALRTMRSDASVGAVVVTGTGDVFLSGLDVGKVTSTVGDMTPVEWREVRDLFHEQFVALYDMPKPTIAAVNGSAVVSGVDIALTCDFRIASDDARFRVGFRRVALMPTPAICYLLPRTIGLGRAKLMAMADPFVSADEALDWGLVEEVVPRAGLMDRVLEFAHELADGPALMIGATKEAMNKSAGLNFDEIRREIDNAQFTLTRTQDYREAMQAFAEKREPRYQGQ